MGSTLVVKIHHDGTFFREVAHSGGFFAGARSTEAQPRRMRACNPRSPHLKNPFALFFKTSPAEISLQVMAGWEIRNKQLLKSLIASVLKLIDSVMIKPVMMRDFMP